GRPVRVRAVASPRRVVHVRHDHDRQARARGATGAAPTPRREGGTRPRGGSVVTRLVMACLAFAALGCGSGYGRNVATARKAIELTAEAGASADRTVADTCYRGDSPLADERPRECSRATDALVATRQTLLGA